MKIKYKIETDGQATNLQFVKDDYVALEGEKIIKGGDALPNISTLHTQVYKDYLTSLAADKQAIADAVTTDLPSLVKVYTAIDNLPLDAATKTFLKKLGKLLYHHIKGTTNGGT